jgi:hypothetical protein
VAFRRHTLQPLDDCLHALRATIPYLTNSSLHRCPQRHGIGRLPEVEDDKPARQVFKAYPIGFFHIDIAEVQTAEGRLSVAVDRPIKEATVQRYHYDSHQRLPGLPSGRGITPWRYGGRFRVALGWWHPRRRIGRRRASLRGRVGSRRGRGRLT